MYVCVCRAVTDHHIRDAAARGAHTLKDLRRIFGITKECGRCTECARELLRESHEEARRERV
jgi:bacterioferritin-associated ferredoxin